MLKEFKEFAMRGNVVDMAVGIIIGAAFGTIIASLVSEVLMPPIGLLLGNVDFSNLFLVLKEGKTAGPYATVAAAKGAGAVTLNYGLFVNTVVNFLIVAFAIFFLIRGMNSLKKKEEAPRRADDEGLPALPVDHPHQGDAMRPLHLGAQGRIGGGIRRRSGSSRGRCFQRGDNAPGGIERRHEPEFHGGAGSLRRRR